VCLVSVLFFVHAAGQSSQGTPEVIAGDKNLPIDRGERPTIDADGTLHIRSFSVPLSNYISREAKAAFIEAVRRERDDEDEFLRNPPKDPYSCERREPLDSHLRTLIDHARASYAVRIEERRISGVRTDVITPAEGIPVRNQHRALIELHGGGFACDGSGGLSGQVEAILISAVAKIKVIAIDYRTSPQFHFPAAVEDVAAVYTELLKQYRSQNVGIYGCSTGANLTASAVAWFQTHALPRPGAVGLFCDGATKDDHLDGDGWYAGMVVVLGNSI
jgi:acetyl esterase/lipase